MTTFDARTPPDVFDFARAGHSQRPSCGEETQRVRSWEGGGGPLDPTARVLRHRAGGYSPPNGSHGLVKDDPQTDDDPESLQY